MSLLYWIGLVVTVLLAVYLFVAMLITPAPWDQDAGSTTSGRADGTPLWSKPEKF
jgi:K+-transporting ATPase KdpF subunit